MLPLLFDNILDNFYMQSCTNNASDYEPACITLLMTILILNIKLSSVVANLAKKDYSFNCANLNITPRKALLISSINSCPVAYLWTYVAYQVKDKYHRKGFNVIYYTVIEFDLEGSSEMTKYKKVATSPTVKIQMAGRWKCNRGSRLYRTKRPIKPLPVYQLIFIKDADNYILNDIIKQ